MFLQRLHLVVFYLQYCPETRWPCISLWVLKGRNHAPLPSRTLQRWPHSGDGGYMVRWGRWTQQSPCTFGRTADPEGHGCLGVISMGQLTLRVSLILCTLMPLSYVQPRDLWKQQKELRLNFPLVQLVLNSYLMSDRWATSCRHGLLAWVLGGLGCGAFERTETCIPQLDRPRWTERHGVFDPRWALNNCFVKWMDLDMWPRLKQIFALFLW